MPVTRSNLHGDPKRQARKRASLKLRVHLEALRRTPGPYLTALWWHLLRKKVRARAQLAPLLAESPLAYRLWLLNEKSANKSFATYDFPLVALVDVVVDAGQEALEVTLRSLSTEGVTAVVVGERYASSPSHIPEAIDWSRGPWLMPLVAGDVLAAGAGDVYRKVASTATSRLVYADDDLVDARGQRHTPHFKPKWNAELLSHFDYLTGACILQASAQDFSALSGSAWAAQLVATATADVDPIQIPHVLHHRRARPSPRVPDALVVHDAELPLISVIVPTRNGLELLRTCIDGLARTDYANIEVIVVDNGSDDPLTLAYLESLDSTRHRVLRAAGPFNFSILNNLAAAQAAGQLLCLLNNDIEVMEADWLRTMAAQALRPEVGAVGAQLLYPNGRIQHAGVVLGVGGGAGHAHRLLYPDEEGYFRRHALPQFVSAVTAACLVVQAERFAAVGGFDERHFAVAFNDVDLCMRLNARGWQSLYEPRAKLVHHESVSRGFDRDSAGASRLAAELAALKARWGTGEKPDPFHHYELSPFSERFVVRL